VGIQKAGPETIVEPRANQITDCDAPTQHQTDGHGLQATGPHARDTRHARFGQFFGSVAALRHRLSSCGSHQFYQPAAGAARQKTPSREKYHS
jgi:hypothetical protein